MRYIDPTRGTLTFSDEAVPGWSADTAKETGWERCGVQNEPCQCHPAPNDSWQEFVPHAPVGGAWSYSHTTRYDDYRAADAELDAAEAYCSGGVRKTGYDGLCGSKGLAEKAVEEADKMGRNWKPDVNADFNNQVRAPLHPPINGQVVTETEY